MQDSTPPLREWHGELSWLNPTFTGKSLPHDARIELDGLVYPALTSALVALKTGDQEERRQISKMAPYTALSWGELRPKQVDPWYAAYKKDVIKWAIPLVAQRFGAVESDIDYGYKLELGLKLIRTGNKPLVWVNHEHDTYFGQCACIRHNRYLNSASSDGARGDNMLGQLMMLVREDLRKNFEGDLDGADCYHCWNRTKEKAIKPATVEVIYWKDGRLCRYPACDKHVSTVAKHGKRHAKRRKVYQLPLSKKAAQSSSPWDHDDWEDWKVYEHSWNGAAAGAASTTYYASARNWNVIIFDPASDEEMVEHVLEPK